MRDPHQRMLFTGSGYRIGEFSCPPQSPRWAEVNWIGAQAHLVIPSTAVAITAAGGDRYVATANEILLYDQDVHYRRELISQHGDRCLFIIIDDELAQGWPRTSWPRLRHLPLAAGSYARHCLLQTVPLPAEQTEEWVLDLISTVVSALGLAQPPALPARQRAAVEQLKSLLASPGHRPVSLAEYAAAVHYSPFALARMFRAHTGYSIGQFRRQLRLRASVAEVLGRDDLSAVAARHGFSSHSHYTNTFRRAFGFTPSQARARQVLLR
ncbi:helix-turn-helix transcriptional regulator [Rhizocola hellebori]|nr:helix-turn-helix transcriptional regulator [Rhizocola hellebori]